MFRGWYPPSYLLCHAVNAGAADAVIVVPDGPVSTLRQALSKRAGARVTKPELALQARYRMHQYGRPAAAQTIDHWLASGSNGSSPVSGTPDMSPRSAKEVGSLALTLACRWILPERTTSRAIPAMVPLPSTANSFR